jgi:hypothetical protein
MQLTTSIYEYISYTRIPVHPLGIGIIGIV